MKVPWALVGGVTGFTGMLIGLAAIGARLAGHYHLGGFEALTVFQGGVGLLVAGCFFKLHAIASH